MIFFFMALSSTLSHVSEKRQFFSRCAQSRSVSMQGNQSEVARFRQQQALYEKAMQQVFTGFAAVARHAVINARMQRNGDYILKLIQEDRHEEARALLETDSWTREEPETAPTRNRD
jgi:hypothetical protein